MTETTRTETWLTQDAHDRLKAELEHRSGDGRAELAQRIEAARAEGDLKENGGYHAAKDEQGKVEDRIRQVEDMLRRAVVGEAKNDGTIAPGMKVSYSFVGDDDVEVLLLGAKENEDGSILAVSPQSPLGSALVGAKKGDVVSYEAPNGKTIEVKVVDAEVYAG